MPGETHSAKIRDSETKVGNTPKVTKLDQQPLDYDSYALILVCKVLYDRYCVIYV